MIEVTLYGKAGCCLCDEARGELETLRAQRSCVLREVDVSLDPLLHRRYGERIPVVEVAGEEVSELGVEPEAVAEALDKVTP